MDNRNQDELQFPERLRLLERVRVVLVESKFAGNIGSVARAMKNTGFSDLRLVSPRAELDKEAYMMALSGTDILDRAVIHQSLADALADCNMVFGTTRRKGLHRTNVIEPKDMALLAASGLALNNVALVFGNEESGLANDDLMLCHYLVGIATGVDTDSLNLSHAVLLLLYTLNREMLSSEPEPRKLAEAQSLESMFQHIQEMLIEIGFIHEPDPRRMMTVIRRTLHRAGLNDREVRIIRGILRQTKWRIENPGAEGEE